MTLLQLKTPRLRLSSNSANVKNFIAADATLKTLLDPKKEKKNLENI